MPGESEAPRGEEAAQSPIQEGGVPFGPSFFLRQLGAFVQESCPASRALPVVQIHVIGGEILDLCHIIALAPGWIALAVYDAASDGGVRTELVPYAMVARVTIRLSQEGSRIGFDATRAPEILEPRHRSLSPGEALIVAAGLSANDQVTPR
jgi:hypothetical protein